MLRLIINLNRCLNTIYGIQAQDNDHNKEFLDSYTGVYTYILVWGDTRIISGGNFSPNREMACNHPNMTSNNENIM